MPEDGVASMGKVRAIIGTLAPTYRDPNAAFSLEDLNDGSNGHAIVLEMFDDYLADKWK
jgi:hypothetical protein